MATIEQIKPAPPRWLIDDINEAIKEGGGEVDLYEIICVECGNEHMCWPRDAQSEVCGGCDFTPSGFRVAADNDSDRKD